MISSPLTKLQFELDDILRKNLDKRLYQPKRDDLFRLMRLKVWSERYKVSLAYILEKLVPHYEKMSQRHYIRRKAGPSHGLGVSIAVLTGPAAEEKLREFIAKDFPDDENVAAQREEEKRRCLNLMDENELSGKPRPILAYTSITEYVASYTKRIEHNRRQGARLSKKMAKQPWRGNPWR